MDRIDIKMQDFSVLIKNACPIAIYRSPAKCRQHGDRLPRLYGMAPKIAQSHSNSYRNNAMICESPRHDSIAMRAAHYWLCVCRPAPFSADTTHMCSGH